MYSLCNEYVIKILNGDMLSLNGLKKYYDSFDKISNK